MNTTKGSGQQPHWLTCLGKPTPRHSFISYRLAKTKDIAATALEAGNSAQMIFAHYRQLCTEAEAQEWFGVLPPFTEARNVVQMTV